MDVCGSHDTDTCKSCCCYVLYMMELMFKELSEEQHKFWREILAENFDYRKYNT